MRRVALGLIALLIVATAAGAAGLWWLDDWFERPGPLDPAAVVLLPQGAGLGAIAGRLERAGAIANGDLFALAVIRNRAERALQAGEYRLDAGASPHAVMDQLIAGRTLVHRVTVPEGLTSAEIVALVEADDALSGVVGARPKEGSLLPETYHFSRGDERSVLLARMAVEMTNTLVALWPARSSDVELATVEEALILASIIEKETGLANERLRITRRDGSSTSIQLPGEACGPAGRFGRPHYRIAAGGRMALDLRFVDGGCHALAIDLEDGESSRLDHADGGGVCRDTRRIPAEHLGLALRGYIRELEAALTRSSADPAAAYTLRITPDGAVTVETRDFAGRPRRLAAPRFPVATPLRRIEVSVVGTSTPAPEGAPLAVPSPEPL